MTAPQPMKVLTDTTVTWGQHANGVPVTRFTRHGTVVEIVPGSARAAAYGGSGNLAPLTPGDPADSDHSELED